MYKYVMTVGLNDKDTCTQLISTEAAKLKIENLLLDHFGLAAFTMWECTGSYQMLDGRIVREPSIRIEIAHDYDFIKTIHSVIGGLKAELNQECIMLEKCESNIEFR